MNGVGVSVTQNIFGLLEGSAQCKPHVSLSTHLFIFYNY